jgi:hypothetical protein
MSVMEMAALLLAALQLKLGGDYAAPTKRMFIFLALHCANRKRFEPPGNLRNLPSGQNRKSARSLDHLVQPECEAEVSASTRSHRTPSPPIVSLGWDGGRRGDPWSILGEPGEACVQDGGNDGAHDRGRHIQPNVGEIARCDHGAKRSGRVESGARQRASHNDVESQRHSDRQRRKAAGAPCDRRAKHDRNQEKGEHSFDYEAGSWSDRKGRGANGEIVRERGGAEAGRRTAQHGPNKSAPVMPPRS